MSRFIPAAKIHYLSVLIESHLLRKKSRLSINVQWFFFHSDWLGFWWRL